MKRQNKINQDVQWVKNNIVKVPRSTFYMKQDWQGTFNAGELVPFYNEDVLPGDTMSLSYSNLTRTVSTLIKPVMGTMELVFYAFFCPFRITWSNFDKFISGYQEDPDWTTDVNLVVPQLAFSEYNHSSLGLVSRSCVSPHTLGDYLGLPINVANDYGGDLDNAIAAGDSVSALYARGYCLIWNEWFRDESTQKSISVNLGDLTGNSRQLSYGYLNGGDVVYPDLTLSQMYSSNYSPEKYGRLCPLNKKRDLFTSALPNAQKGAPVNLNLAGDLPVYGVYGNVSGKDDNFSLISSSGAYGGNNYGIHIGSPTGLDSKDYVKVQGTDSDVGMSGTIHATTEGQVKYEYLNLFAKLSNATAINVNDLRLAVQTQMIKEIDARYGTRPKEYYQGHFGVLTADSRLQIPEFLGAARVLLNVNQVIQTSATSAGVSEQGNQSAYSQTQSKGHLFTKSFTEHGFVMVVGGVRVVGRSYSQGIAKKFSQKTRFDFYLPELAHIGEQPIRNKEIYFGDVTDNGVLDNMGVYGYQQAWYQYRFTPNKVTGLLRPNATGTLAYWNFSENFIATPTLSPAFIVEDRTLIDRCLAIPSTNSETGKYTGVDQFLTEFWWENKVTRPMPISSAPGLLDHSGRILL